MVFGCSVFSLGRGCIIIVFFLFELLVVSVRVLYVPGNVIPYNQVPGGSIVSTEFRCLAAGGSWRFSYTAAFSLGKLL